MGLFSTLLGGDEWRGKPPEEKRADISRHKATKAAAENSRRIIRDVGHEYNQLNNAIIDAEQHVPWWRR